MSGRLFVLLRAHLSSSVLVLAVLLDVARPSLQVPGAAGAFESAPALHRSMLKLSVSNSAQMSLQFRFRERLEPFKAHLPEAAERVIEEELEKLQVGSRS